jgi:hypothetical protein
MLVVREQSFTKGRDVVLAPPENVHTRIDEGSTGLAEAGRVYRDGTVRLDWTATEFWLGGR